MSSSYNSFPVNMYSSVKILLAPPRPVGVGHRAGVAPEDGNGVKCINYFIGVEFFVEEERSEFNWGVTTVNAEL